MGPGQIGENSPWATEAAFDRSERSPGLGLLVSAFKAENGLPAAGAGRGRQRLDRNRLVPVRFQELLRAADLQGRCLPGSIDVGASRPLC